jgi:hypothetical protein
MRHVAGIAAAFALLLAACGDDSTGPDGPFALIVTANTRSAEIDLTDEQPYICEYKAIAKTEGGEKGEYAEWLGGRLDWIVKDSVVYRFNLSAAELLDRFGRTTIGRNTRQNFIRSASGVDPYDLQLTLVGRHSSGEVLSDSTLIVCDFPADVMAPTNLAGSWTASWFKFESTDTNIWQVELISSGGSLSIALEENGSFSGSADYPNLAGAMEAQPVSGALTVVESESITNGTVTFTFAEGPFGTLTGTLTRVQNQLILEVPEGAAFDFNRDGRPDPASLEARFDLIPG